MIIVVIIITHLACKIPAEKVNGLSLWLEQPPKPLLWSPALPVFNVYPLCPVHPLNKVLQSESMQETGLPSLPFSDEEELHGAEGS